MLKRAKTMVKKGLINFRVLIIARLSKSLMSLLMRTCKIHIEGLENFKNFAITEKCILVLWHNRLAIIPFILSQYTPKTNYAALVSGSRDGAILSTIIHLHKNGSTIKVFHQARYQALRETIRNIEERKHIVIITPDGPRGPRYEIKPGIAIAALETQAYIVSMDWEAKRYWELKTWDRLRLPKPFTTITFKFLPPFRLENPDQTSLDEAKQLLKQKLPC